jgi:type I restriction enzyme R subunit
MYLDKPMRDHTLLQAIARINRPYPDKDNGLLLDYVGVFEDLQKALAFDQAAVTKALIDLEALKGQFAGLLETIEAMLAPLQPQKAAGRDARIIEHFFDPDRRDDFRQQFRALQTAYEVISPDPFLYDTLQRYALIAQIQTVVYNYFNPEAEKRRLRHDLLQKTDALIRQNVELVSLASPLPLYPINRDIGNVVAADDVSEQVKVINLYRSLLAHIQAHETSQPFLIPIADEVEEIIQRLKDRQISAAEALKDLEVKTEQAIQAGEERQKSSLEDRAFAFSLVLKSHGLGDVESMALAAQEIIDKYPGWPYNERMQSEVRMSLYRLLMQPPSQVAEERADYKAAGQGVSDVNRLKQIVDDLLRMSDLVGA